MKSNQNKINYAAERCHFFFSVGKKKLFVTERCHMAEGCQTNPEYFVGSTSNMADAWREDLKLREDMERYVRQGYKREEALDVLKRDFPIYPWMYPYSFVRQTFAKFRNLLQ